MDSSDHPRSQYRPDAEDTSTGDPSGSPPAGSGGRDRVQSQGREQGYKEEHEHQVRSDSVPVAMNRGPGLGANAGARGLRRSNSAGSGGRATPPGLGFRLDESSGLGRGGSPDVSMNVRSELGCE